MTRKKYTMSDLHTSSKKSRRRQTNEFVIPKYVEQIALPQTQYNTLTTNRRKSKDTDIFQPESKRTTTAGSINR